MVSGVVVLTRVTWGSENNIMKYTEMYTRCGVQGRGTTSGRKGKQMILGSVKCLKNMSDNKRVSPRLGSYTKLLGAHGPCN